MNIFEETGCQESSEYLGLYVHPELPFYLYEKNGKLRLTLNLDRSIDDGKIPATVNSIKRLVVAFNPKKYQHSKFKI
jgi:hypothetical protein